ncbi:MAG: FAD-dependent oxidoreductase, partial [Alphaproteobacteria bacterium]
ALNAIFTQPPFDVTALADETLICRCEEVSAGRAREVCRTVDPSLATIKRMTRAGMGRCQGRYCVGPLTKLVQAEGGAAPDAAAFFAPRPPAKPVPLAAVALEKPEWGGHRQAVPPPSSPRPSRDRVPFGLIETDVAVIGAGVVGACVARELASAGYGVTVLDRHEPNVQASGANAGSMHVQLLSFDFGAKAQAGGRPAAEVLRIAPASIRLWQELEKISGEDLEISTPGGLMVAETESEMAFLEQKVALERSYGLEAELIGANELRALEPYLAPHLIGAAYCKGEGKINPLTATYAVVRLAKAAGARFEGQAAVTAISREGGRWKIDTEAGTVLANRVVNCAGGWASLIAAMAARPIPVQGAPLQMIVTEPGPALVSCLIAHAGRHLSLKQATSGGLIIGGAWPATQDLVTGASHVERESVEGNAWVATHVLPAASALRIVRVWAGMNINIDGAPILGEMPGAPGFFNCVTSNGYSLAPVVARITADIMVHGRSDFPVAPFTLERFG